MEPPALPPQGVSRRTRLVRRVLRVVVLPVAALALAGCTVPSFGVVPGDTTSSRSVYHLWEGFTVGAMIIGFGVSALIIWAALRYRRRNHRDNMAVVAGNGEGREIPKQVQYHLPLEWTYTIIPIIIIVGLFFATMVVENKEVSNPKTDVTINVNAFQWGWKFTYPGHDVVVVGQTTQDPEMVMPVNTDVHINLTSSDVVHGFYVHDFNFSRYALPGVLNQFTFRAVNTGTFNGQCTQLCGLYHSLMFFRVKVVTMPQYTQWLASNADAQAAQASQTATGQQTTSNVPTKPTKSEGDN